MFSGLVQPTAVRFAGHHPVFVAEKSAPLGSLGGTFDGCHNFWDRGLLAIALDPAFPANPCT